MSAGRGVVAFTITDWPALSHCACLQLPGGVTLVSTVPDAVLVHPQLPAWQFFFLQKVSVPGHCETVTQPSHAPFRQAMPDPHAVPFGLFGLEATPALQFPVVHAVSGGRFVSLFTIFVPPSPSHCVCLQYPGSGYPVAIVLLGLVSKPQTPDVQVRG